MVGRRPRGRPGRGTRRRDHHGCGPHGGGATAGDTGGARDVSPCRPRPDQDAAVERSAAAPGPARRSVSPGERPGRRRQSLLARVAAALWRLRPAGAVGPDHVATRSRRRGLRRHPQGHGPRLGAAHRSRRPRPLRQSHLGLGAGDGDAGDGRRADRGLRPGVGAITRGAARARSHRRRACAPPSAARSGHGGWHDRPAVRQRDSRGRRPGHARRRRRAEAVPRARRPDAARAESGGAGPASAGRRSGRRPARRAPRPAAGLSRRRLALCGAGGGRRRAAARFGRPRVRRGGVRRRHRPRPRRRPAVRVGAASSIG